MNSDLLSQFKILANGVSSLGFVESLRRGNTGVGYTYETCLGIKENNSMLADFGGEIEIKTKRVGSKSMMTLFTQSPKSSKTVMPDFYSRYAQLDSSGRKSLHSTISGHRFNNYKRLYNFKLEVDRDLSLVWILAKEKGQSLGDVHRVGFYTFSELAVLCKKIDCLALVESTVESRGDVEFFKYSEPAIYRLKGIDYFLRCLETGVVVLDVRVGTYKSGKNKGKPHDHGAAFRIRPSKMKFLFYQL